MLSDKRLWEILEEIWELPKEEFIPNCRFIRMLRAAADEAYRAGQEGMRERAADFCDGHDTNGVGEAIRALPVQNGHKESE